MSIRDQWESEVRKPSYQGASDADREAIRQDFFETRVASRLLPDQAAQAREVFNHYTAPQGDPNSGALNDVRLAVQSGAMGGFGDLTQGVMFGRETALSDWFRKKSDEYQMGMSPSMIEEMAQTGFDYDSENGISIKEGSTVRGAVGLVAQGTGSLAPSIIPGMAASRALSVAGRAAFGTSASISAATKARSAYQAKQAFARASMIDTGARHAGFGLTGGASMIGSTVNQSYEDLMSLPQEERNKSEPYQRRFYELREQGLTDSEASEQAWEEVAREASRSNMGKSFLFGFASSALSGPIEEKLLRGAGSATRRANIARGLATEMTQEAVESGWQEIGANLSVANAGVERDMMEGVVGNTLTGMAVGGFIGGAMGAASKPNKPRTREELSKEYEAYQQKAGETEKKLKALDNSKETNKDKIDTERMKLETELGSYYQHLHNIDQEFNSHPTTEQLGQSQKNQKVKPALDSKPSETPSRRGYLPYNVDVMLAEAERDNRKIMSDYNRAVGSKGRGDMDTAKRFEQELARSNNTVKLLKLLTNNRHNQQYFPHQFAFDEWIKKQYIGGEDNLREAHLELQGRKAERTIDEALAPLRKEQEAIEKEIEAVWQKAEEHKRQQRRREVEKLAILEGKQPTGLRIPLEEVHQNLQNRGMMKDAKSQVAPKVEQPPVNQAMAGAMYQAALNEGKGQQKPQAKPTAPANTGKKVARPTSRQAMAEAKKKRKERVKEQVETQKQEEHEARLGMQNMVREDMEARRPGALAALDKLKQNNEAIRLRKQREADKKAGKERWQQRKKQAAPKPEPVPAHKAEKPAEKKPEKSEREQMQELIREDMEERRPGAMDTVRKWRSDKKYDRLPDEVKKRLKERGIEKSADQVEFESHATHIWTDPVTGNTEPVIYLGDDVFPGGEKVYVNFENEYVVGRPSEFQETDVTDRVSEQEAVRDKETEEAEDQAELEKQKAEAEERRAKEAEEAEKQRVIDKAEADKERKAREEREAKADADWKAYKEQRDEENRKKEELEARKVEGQKEIKQIQSYAEEVTGWEGLEPRDNIAPWSEIGKNVLDNANPENARKVKWARTLEDYYAKLDGWKDNLVYADDNVAVFKGRRNNQEIFYVVRQPDAANYIAWAALSGKPDTSPALWYRDYDPDPFSSGNMYGVANMLSGQHPDGLGDSIKWIEGRPEATNRWKKGWRGAVTRVWNTVSKAIGWDKVGEKPELKGKAYKTKSLALIDARQRIENGELEGSLGNWSPVETESGWKLKYHEKPIFPSIKILEQFNKLTGKELDFSAVAMTTTKKKSGEKNADREKRIRGVYDLYTSLQPESVDSLVKGLNKKELQDIARQLGLYKSHLNKTKLSEKIIKWRDDNIIKASVYREHKSVKDRLRELHKNKLPIPRVDAESLDKHGTIYTTADTPVARILDMDYLYPKGERGDNEWLFDLTENLVEDKKVEEFKQAMRDSPEAMALLPELDDVTYVENWVLSHDASALAKAIGVPDAYAREFSQEFGYDLTELLKDSNTTESDTDNTGIKEPVSSVSEDSEVLPLDKQRKILEKQLEDSNKGSTATVTVPGTNQKLEVQYRIVENSDLVASHNIKGDENPSYPSELQPRDRSRASSEAQILDIAGRFDPELAVGSVLTSDGAPIVNADNQVESGNGRTLALRNVYKTKNELAEKYKQYLIDHAEEFGLDPERVKAMNEPQLVRERITDLDSDQLQNYLENSNEKDVAGKSTSEQAVSDSNVLTDDLMAKFRPGKYGDLNTAANQEFLGRFLQGIKGDKTKLHTTDGGFSQAFFQRLQGALFAKAYQDNDLIGLALEEDTSGIQNIIKALNVSAPDFARVNAKYADLGDLNMVPKLVEGIRVLRDAKKADQVLDEYINQGDMLSASDIDPMAAMFAQYIDLNDRRHKQMGEAFRELARMIDQELGRRGEPDILGDYQSQSTSDIVSPLVKNLKDQGKSIGGGTSDFFTASGKVRETTETKESGRPVSSGSLADQQGQNQGEKAETATKEIKALADHLRNKDAPEKDINQIIQHGELSGGQLKDTRTGHSFSGKTISKNTTYKYAKEWIQAESQKSEPDTFDDMLGSIPDIGKLAKLNDRTKEHQKFENIVKKFADDIDELKPVNLRNVLVETQYGNDFSGMEHYLRQERPDLDSEISTTIAELNREALQHFAESHPTFPGGWQRTVTSDKEPALNIAADGKDYRITFDPYANRYTMRSKSGEQLTGVKDLKDAIDVIKGRKKDVPSTAGNLEPDSRKPEAETRQEPETVSNEPGTDRPGDGEGVSKTGEGQLPGSRGSVSEGDTTATGVQGDQSVHPKNQQTGTQGEPAGSTDSQRSGEADATGSPAQRPANQSTEVAAQSPALELQSRLDAQKQAESIPVIRGDLDNIRETLPVLMPEQQEDVSFIEKRLWEDDERGGMLTNGTGTGKTFSGMGTIKRFVKEGKKNILIITPSQGINAAWIGAGKAVGVDMSILPDTSTAGEGVVVTTYANLGENNALSGRDWDLIVTDESHNLKESDSFDQTQRLASFRALTGHPQGIYTRAEKQNPELVKKLQSLPEKIKILEKSDNNQDWYRADQLKDELSALRKEWSAITKQVSKEAEAIWEGKQVKSLMLSATPFAHRKTIDYAEGFLFDYPVDDKAQGYYSQSGQTQYFIQNFGYRFRYGKLTEPDVDVDTGLMERQFNERLKESGAMRSRMLEVEKDYDRRFELVEGGIGAEVDGGLKFLDEIKRQAIDSGSEEDAVMWQAVQTTIEKRFNYHTRAYLLESIKANAAVEYIQQHLDMGRKSVVFHDYNTGGGFHPFKWSKDMEETAVKNSIDPRIAKKGFERLAKERPDLINLPLENLANPRDTFMSAFGDQLVLYSGQESKKQRAADIKEFNDDNGSKKIILVNSAAGNAGISLHDTTGQHQRVLLNLGIPVRPTFAIQIEGRTYRVGLQSNAMFRYMSTGLTFERYMVASKLAARAGTAENLAMGDDARALEDGFIESYKDAGEYGAGMEGEGIGGKARDRMVGGDVSDFDKAKTFYFAKQKRTQRTKAQEGLDYFATPEPLGMKVVEWLHAKPGDSMLEPSAGDGSMARWMPDFASVTAVEPSYELAGQLSMNAPTAKIVSGTFENLNLQNKYDGIAMNPPYGKASKLAVEHVAKAFKHLRDGGRMIAIIPQGPASDTKLNKWYESKEAKSAHISAEINLPAVTFDRAGTKVATRILIIDRIDDANASVPAKRTVDIKADNIKDFFDQIQDMEFGRERIEKTAEQKTSEIAENPTQYLEDNNLEVIDYGDGTYDFKGKGTYKLKPALKKNGAVWYKADKAWTGHGDPESYLARVANDIENLKTSPLAEHRMAVSQDHQGKFVVYGDGIWDVRDFLEANDAHYDKKRATFTFDTDPTDSILKEVAGSERYNLAPSDSPQIHRKPYENKAIADKAKEIIGDMAQIVPSVDSLPKHLQEQIRNDNLTTRVKGVYDPRTGEVYVIANHAESVKDAVRTAIHEAVGHKGLHGVLGDRINSVLDGVYNSLPDSEIRELRETYANQIAGKPYAEQRRIISEEYLAHIAELEPSNNWLQKAIAKVRQWLRSVMPNMKWTDNDVRQLIMDASQFAQQPADNRPGIDQPGTNPDQVDTPEAGRYKLKKVADMDKATAKKEIGRSLRSMKEFIRSKSLGWLGGRQIAETYSKVFDGLIERDKDGNITKANPLVVIKNLTQELSATRNEWANKADKVDQIWSKLAGDQRSYQLTADTMHESTLLEQDPSIDYIPTPGIKQIEADHKSAILAGDEETRVKLQPKMDKEAQRRKDYKKLKTMYDGMGETGQQVYNDVKKYYENMWEEQKKALVYRVEGMNLDPNATGKIKAQVEAMFRRNTLDGPYFPLMRFGEFGVVGRTPKTDEHPAGQPYREHFESQKDMEKGIEQLESMGYTIDSSGKNVQSDPRQMSGVTEFSNKIFQSLTDDKKMGQIDMDDRMAFMDEVNQIALSLLPELSAAKRAMHRKGIAGFDTNARRAFASTALHGANRLGRTKHGWQIESELNRMDEATASDKYSHNLSTEQKIIGRSVAEEMRRRHDLNMNPNGSAAAAFATNAAFFWYLGGSAAAGLVNLTQNILVALPQLGSKYGYAKTSRMMARASFDYFRMGKRKINGVDDLLGNAWVTLEGAKGLPDDERAMMQELIDDGTIDVTQAHTLANIAGQDLRPESQKTRDWYTKLTRASGVFFHNAEVANRQIAALTAYRLQKEAAAKAGKDFDSKKAIADTRDAVFDAHFDYSSYNRPRHFKGNWSKVFLIFKQHSQNMTYNLGKTFYDGVLDRSLKGTEEGQKQREAAQRALIGTLGLHALFAGAMGLPGFSALMFFASKFMGDKDDPVDPEVVLRNFFADVFGPTHGHALAKGVFNGYLGIDMHQRTKLDELWLSSPGYDMPARQEAMYYVANGIGGPAISQAVNAWVGFNEVTDGETFKGLQRMLPKFVRDGMKTWEYSKYGVLDRKGQPILEQLTPAQKAWQAVGFAPSGISEGYAGKGAIEGYRGRVQKRKQQLLNQLDRAARTDDQKLYQKTMVEVDRFNEVQSAKGKDYRGNLLTRSSIRRSLSQRARRRNESEQAVWLPSSQLGMMDLGRFALH